MEAIIIILIIILLILSLGINSNKGGIIKPPISNSVLTEGKTKSSNKNITFIDKTECVPPSAGPRRSATIGYMHVVEDSHRWTDIKQMLEWLKYKFETVDKQYLKTGLENTLNAGYNLINLKELIEQNPNDAELGKAIRQLNG